MMITAMPRWRAEHIDLAVPYAVISITDPPPDGEPAKIKQRWGLQGVLRLEFHDFDTHWDQSTLQTGYQGKRLSEWCMTKEHAEQVADFVYLMQGRIHELIVHCEAGASRSPSMAMAIAHVMNGSSYITWEGHQYHGVTPNKGVYEVTLAAMRKKELEVDSR